MGFPYVCNPGPFILSLSKDRPYFLRHRKKGQCFDKPNTNGYRSRGIMSILLSAPFACPCCGFSGLGSKPYAKGVTLPVSQELKPPYSQYFGLPSYEVCDCCGFEFGFDDEPGVGAPDTFSGYLGQWISEGQTWFSPRKRPDGWTLREQLKIAGIPFPD
jgi:hypothetical protein